MTNTRKVQGVGGKCDIEFFRGDSLLTCVTCVFSFYIPVCIMMFLYWRIWLTTKLRYKDLSLFQSQESSGLRINIKSRQQICPPQTQHSQAELANKAAKLRHSGSSIRRARQRQDFFNTASVPSATATTATSTTSAAALTGAANNKSAAVDRSADLTVANPQQTSASAEKQQDKSPETCLAAKSEVAAANAQRKCHASEKSRRSPKHGHLHRHKACKAAKSGQSQPQKQQPQSVARCNLYACCYSSCCSCSARASLAKKSKRTATYGYANNTQSKLEQFLNSSKQLLFCNPETLSQVYAKLLSASCVSLPSDIATFSSPSNYRKIYALECAKQQFLLEQFQAREFRVRKRRKLVSTAIQTSPTLSGCELKNGAPRVVVARELYSSRADDKREQFFEQESDFETKISFKKRHKRDQGSDEGDSSELELDALLASSKVIPRPAQLSTAQQQLQSDVSLDAPASDRQSAQKCARSSQQTACKQQAVRKVTYCCCGGHCCCVRKSRRVCCESHCVICRREKSAANHKAPKQCKPNVNPSDTCARQAAAGSESTHQSKSAAGKARQVCGDNLLTVQRSNSKARNESNENVSTISNSNSSLNHQSAQISASSNTKAALAQRYLDNTNLLVGDATRDKLNRNRELNKSKKLTFSDLLIDKQLINKRRRSSAQKNASANPDCAVVELKSSCTATSQVPANLSSGNQQSQQRGETISANWLSGLFSPKASSNSQVPTQHNSTFMNTICCICVCCRKVLLHNSSQTSSATSPKDSNSNCDSISSKQQRNSFRFFNSYFWPVSSRLSNSTVSNNSSLGHQATSPATTRPLRISNIQSKSERKAARTLTTLLLVFLITWLPYNITVLIKALASNDNYVPERVWNFTYYLCYINSTVNPICYALCNAQFRNTYMRILRCKFQQDSNSVRLSRRCNLNNNHNHISSTQATTTTTSCASR